MAGARVSSGAPRASSRARRPDICHTTLFDADVIGRVASIGSGAKLVCSLVNAAYGPEQLANPAVTPWRLRTVQLVDIVTARRVRRFHAVSESVAASMAGRLKVRRDRIDVIPRGRDPQEIGTRTAARRTAARRSLGVDDDAPLLLAVGRHEYQKGFDVLLDSFAVIRRDRPTARVCSLPAARGAESAKLRDRAAGLDLGESVVFLGFRSDIPELLCAADVFVSASRWEGSPGGVIEAMALETPIVAGDIAPVREVLGDGAPAWLVAPRGAGRVRGCGRRGVGRRRRLGSHRGHARPFPRPLHDRSGRRRDGAVLRPGARRAGEFGAWLIRRVRVRRGSAS